MAKHRIVCVEKRSVDEPHEHKHIVKVGTGTTTGHHRVWLISDVYAAMDAGDTFDTKSRSTKKTAGVSKYACEICNGFKTLRSNHDAVADNNLDNLPACD
jgi:hypothetical protein